MRPLLRALAACLALSLAPVAVAHARPGTLDHAFSGNGMATPSLAGSKDNAARSLARTPDRRLVVSGPTATAGLVVARLRPHGSLDRGFGARGLATVPLPGTTPDGGTGLAVFRDGRTLVCATLVPADGTAWRIACARLLGDGTLDPGFGTGGVALVGPGGARVEALALTRDGDLVLGGAMPGLGSEQPIVLRLLPDGTPDPAFGAGGVAAAGAPVAGRVRALALGPDGAVAAAVSVDPSLLAPDGLVLARWTPAGVPDPAVGLGTGVAALPSTGVVAQGLGAAGVALDPLGRTVVGGTGLDGGRLIGVVVRFAPDGSLDPTFGKGGVTRLELRDPVRVRALAVRRGGRIFVGGHTAPPWSVLFRLRANGRLDTSFGHRGVVRRVLGRVRGPEKRSSIAAILPVPGDRVVVAGDVQGRGRAGRTMVARLTG
jgi:uncharacterized delta-60 repeat protein